MRPIHIFIGIVGLLFAFLIIAGILLAREATQVPTTAPVAIIDDTVGVPAATLTQTPSETPSPIIELARNTVTSTSIASTAVPYAIAPQPTNPPAPTTGVTSSPTAQSNPAYTSTATPTRTRRPTSTRTTVSSPSNTPTRTPTVTSTATPALGSITGRITFQGVPVNGSLVLSLEDSSSFELARTTIGADGSFSFVNLPTSAQGYSVVFAQEWNTQFETEQVLSWAWIGPMPIAEGSRIQLPDFDISALGFGQIEPVADIVIPANEITPDTPLLFIWSAYPGASRYWVDLARGDEQYLVWKSRLSSSNTLSFDGTFTDGTRIYIGEYWWAVGAQGTLGQYPLTVYGYLLRFIVYP